MPLPPAVFTFATPRRRAFVLAGLVALVSLVLTASAATAAPLHPPLRPLPPSLVKVPDGPAPGVGI